MVVTLYNNSSDNRNLTKSLSVVRMAGNVILHEDSSIYRPHFTIRGIGDENDVLLTNVNYCYIPRFQRYYYIDNIVIGAGAQKEYYCSCDVLMSFAAQIRALRGVHVVRKNDKPTYTIDTRLPMTPNKTIETIKLKTGAFDSGVFNLKTADNNSYNYILTVSGGGTNDS